jgi:hypothetical protein
MASYYCTLAQLQAYNSVTGITVAADDSFLVDVIKRASRAIERICRRSFYPTTATKKFDHPDNVQWMSFGADLLSCTSLTVDGTVIPSTEYYLKPSNAKAYQWIELKKGSGYYFEWTDTDQESVSIAGIWGWHDNYAEAYEASGQTVQNATQISASGTTLTVTSATNFSVMQTIKVEDELMLITAISTVNLTVTRGLNGTTAAAHLNGVAISIYRPPLDIEHACVRLSTWYYRQREAPFDRTAQGELGMIVIPVSIPTDVDAMLKPYQRMEIGR